MNLEKLKFWGKAYLKDEEKKGSKIPQYFAGICACFGAIQISGYQIWPAHALPYLESEKSPIPISEEQAGWMVSAYLAGETIGCLINPLFIDRIGRKYSLILSAIASLTGLFLIALFDSYICLCIGRIFGGMSQGIFYSSITIYLTEISDLNARGIFMNIIRIFERGGMLLFSLISSGVSYNTLNVIILIVVMICCLINALIPESPYFYFLKHDDERAIKCLTKLRDRDSKDLESDILKIKLVTLEDQKNSKAALLDLFCNKQYRRGLLVLVFSKLTHQMTGVYSIYGYSEKILIDADSPLDPEYGVMVFNLFQFFACFMGICIIEHVRRRVLFITTSLIQTLSLIAVGVFFLLQINFEVNMSSVSWLPLVSLILYGVVFTLGVAPISSLLQGELFPLSVKGVAVAFGSTLGSIVAFIGTLGYTIFKENFGNYSPFLAYAAICFVSSLIVFWITPETKGKSLEDIQGMQNADLQVKLDALSKTKVLSQRTL